MAENKTLYIISGCNGAGKTTASYTVLPEVWECREFVKRVSEGGHNIPSDVIVRRYRAGIDNLFDIYMDCIDYWLLVNNTQGESVYVAEGGKDMKTEIFDTETYNKIKQYVRG